MRLKRWLELAEKSRVATVEEVADKEVATLNTKIICHLRQLIKLRELICPQIN
jgi:hypothetical protein